MKRLPFILAGLALAAITPPAQAVQIPVTGDTTATASTGSAVPNRILKTAGTSVSLPVGPKSTPVLFFNLANSGITASAITKARLVIYFSNVTKAGTYRTVPPTTAFQELFTPTSVPFTPLTASPPDEPVTTANKKGYVISYGYEGIVKDWINNPASNTGIAIVGDATLSATISSREGAATGVAAFLEIDVNPTAGAVGATTLAVTGDATVGGSLATTGNTTIGGNLGIGTTASSFKLNVGGTLNAQGAATLGSSLTVAGAATIGTSSSIEGAGSRTMTVRSTTSNTFAGYNSQTPQSSWYMGCRGSNSDNWELSTVPPGAGGTPRILVNGLGNVGIGTEPAVGPLPSLFITPRLTVDGTGNFTGLVISNGSILTSDARFKKDITSITRGLDTVKKLRPVTYDWRSDEFPDRNFDTRNHSGFIAQEIGEVLPNVVTEIGGGYLSVNYIEVIPVLTRAIQELAEAKDAEIAALNEKIAALEARAVARVTLDAELEARLVRLEAASGAAAPVKAVTTAFTGKE
jgi:hypothetical protein